jgi:hypothetical protein
MNKYIKIKECENTDVYYNTDNIRSVRVVKFSYQIEGEVLTEEEQAQRYYHDVTVTFMDGTTDGYEFFPEDVDVEDIIKQL